MLPFLMPDLLLADPPKPPIVEAVPSAELLKKARSLRYAQRFYEAAALYRQFIRENPQSGRSAEAHFWLAATLELDQRWDEASEAYNSFLAAHPDERLLGREALLNRIRCWGIRLGQNPKAERGLVAALNDRHTEVKTAAALQLAKKKDKRAIDGLQAGLALPAYAEACSTALVAYGVKAATPRPQVARFLTIKVTEHKKGKSEVTTFRIALALARAIEGYLSDEQLRQAKAKGFDLENLSEKTSELPKGSVLFSVEDKNSRVEIRVE